MSGLSLRSSVVFAVGLTLLGCSLLTTIDDDVSSGAATTGKDGGQSDGPNVIGEGGSSSSSSGGSSSGGDGGRQDNPTCASTRGPTMVRVDVQGTYYCIDSTEVTRKQYADFLQSSPGPSTHPRCGYKNSYVPRGAWPPAGNEQNHPVVQVDWCDAEAFCRWSGKRLCGTFDGKPLSFEDADDFDRSILVHACGGPEKRKFSFGNTYVPNTCNVLDHGIEEPITVASMPSCVGGFPGIYDLVGNVAEWMDACDTENASGDDDVCLAFNSPYYEEAPDEMTCTFLRYDQRRNSEFDYIGFRCCGP